MIIVIISGLLTSLMLQFNQFNNSTQPTFRLTQIVTPSQDNVVMSNKSEHLMWFLQVIEIIDRNESKYDFIFNTFRSQTYI